MTVQLQEIVDKLANQIQRAVAIDDTRLHLVVHSAHHEPVDTVRLASIVQRQAPTAAIEWVLSHGVAEAYGATRIRDNSQLDLRSRICVPIRCQGSLLGYLFFIDAEGTSEAQEQALAELAADTAGMVLYQEQLLAEVGRARKRELLQDLLSGDLPLRQHAAERLVELELFERHMGVAVITVQPVVGRFEDAPSTPPGASLHVALTMALESSWQATSLPHNSLKLIRPTHGAILINPSNPALRGGRLLSMAQDLREALLQHLKSIDSEARVVVGIGAERESLIDAEVSYREALQASRVASHIRAYGDIAVWADLREYQILSKLTPAELTDEMLHSGIKHLLRNDRSGRLLQTAEVYLDDAGDVARTAQELFIHRTTLYYRLTRIEEIANIDLRNGHDRLALHLSIKLARLSGLYE